MVLNRRHLLHIFGSAISTPAVLRASQAQAVEETLNLHHFLPPASNAHTNFLEPWAKKIEMQSGNKLKIRLFPSMQLGGTPQQLFDQACNGAVDIVWTLAGYTPGRFPGLEAFE